MRLPYRMHRLGCRMASNAENHSQLNDGFGPFLIWDSPLFYEAFVKKWPKMPPNPGETLFSP